MSNFSSVLPPDVSEGLFTHECQIIWQHNFNVNFITYAFPLENKIIIATLQLLSWKQMVAYFH